MGYIFSSFTPLIEIAIIAIILNFLFSFFWNTRSMDLVLGLFAFLLIFAFSSLLKLPVLHKIMLIISNVAVIALLIIFQPELRMTLSRLSLKNKKYRQVGQFDKFLDQLSKVVYSLSDKKIGGLIALEHENSLEEFANKAVILDAKFSPELVESIFVPSTPLHDGAIIIRAETILAAAVIFPLAEDSSQLTKSIGTRHRAGLGLSQVSDALVIIISEETGRVSVAREGIMTRGIKEDRFKGIFRSVFAPNPANFKTGFKILEWLKR